MIHLRPYQSAQIDATREALRQHRSVLIQGATGSGKTAIAAFMAGSARAKQRTVWFLAHRDFLLEQTAATFDLVGIPYDFIAAGRPFNPYQPVQICSVGTLRRRLDRLVVPDVVIWDECHHVAATWYQRIYEWAATARHIGLSATPCRLDGKGLRNYFNALVTGPSVGELIDGGYLSRYKAFAPALPNLAASLAGIHTRAGDYARDELDTVMDTDQIIGELIRHYREYADGLRAIYFAVSVRHSEHIAAIFNAAGIPAQHLDGTASTADRITAARAFGRGDIRVISNVDLFGEGYDLASQAGADVAVEAVGLARPTQSLALHLQQVGRALRVAPGKDHAVILDHAGNLLRLGLPDDDREWSLDGIDRKRAKSAGGPPVRQCAECFGVYRAALDHCPYCGAVPELQAREVEEIAGELRELDISDARRVRQIESKHEVGKARTREALEQIARERGYKPGWVDYIIAARTKNRANGGVNRAATIREWKGEPRGETESVNA